MSAFSHIFRRPGSDPADMPMLDFQRGWELPPTEDPVDFLRALPLIVGPGAVLYVEGIRDAHVRDEVARLQTSALASIAVATLWPTPDRYHLPLTAETAEALASFLERHPTDHFCDHCHVYQAQEILLQWYDAFGEPIYLAVSLDASQVRAFARAIGTSLRFAG